MILKILKTLWIVFMMGLNLIRPVKMDGSWWRTFVMTLTMVWNTPALLIRGIREAWRNNLKGSKALFPFRIFVSCVFTLMHLLIATMTLLSPLYTLALRLPCYMAEEGDQVVADARMKLLMLYLPPDTFGQPDAAGDDPSQSS